MSFGRGVIFEYVHKEVKLAILLAFSSDFDYLFKKPYRLQVHILALHAQCIKISAKLSTTEFEYKLA